MRCPQCSGTGEVPDKITLECVGCQTRKVTVTFTSTQDLIDQCDKVRCPDCKESGR
jgi:hypothetical protein